MTKEFLWSALRPLRVICLVKNYEIWLGKTSMFVVAANTVDSVTFKNLEVEKKSSLKIILKIRKSMICQKKLSHTRFKFSLYLIPRVTALYCCLPNNKTSFLNANFFLLFIFKFLLDWPWHFVSKKASILLKFLNVLPFMSQTHTHTHTRSGNEWVSLTKISNFSLIKKIFREK